MLRTYKNVTEKDIRQMKRVCKQHGDTLKIVEGKICMEEEADVDVVLKMFGDYYKQGEVSGKSYGTFSGKELKNSRGEGVCLAILHSKAILNNFIQETDRCNCL